jgi:3-deoxy-D-manno-octulosonic-acid transferase
VSAADQLGPHLLQLLLDAPRRERMGEAAQLVFERERGAVQRVMRLVDGLLQE